VAERDDNQAVLGVLLDRVLFNLGRDPFDDFFFLLVERLLCLGIIILEINRSIFRDPVMDFTTFCFQNVVQLFKSADTW
jgi:hypothetical protein